MKTNVSSLLVLVLLLGITAYLDSPYSFINRPYTFSSNQPAAATLAQPPDPSEQPELVEKLEKKTKVDGYIIETYREYEIYKNKEGTVKKSVPTSKTNTLRYWDYSKQ